MLHDDFDKVCAVCNTRNGLHGHWNNTCPDKSGKLPTDFAVKTYFVDSGKRRTAKCDKNKNPRHYK